MLQVVDSKTTVERYSTTDPPSIAEARSYVFGELVKLAAPIVKHYHGDLFWDALWLNEHLIGDSLTFYWSVDDCGTHIGTDELALYRQDNPFRWTVACDARGRITVTVDTLARDFVRLCVRCGETFNPDGPGDLVHAEREDGTPCGGTGALVRTWG